MIPISKVQLGQEVEELVLEVLRSGTIAQGPRVAELENLFASLNDSRHVIAVNNGTTALIAALEVLDLKPGDEVITSPFTFVATLNAVLATGATVRFADITLDDFCIDPESVESLINDRTKVLMPVHLYGQTADMTRISQIAIKHGLEIVEDAAQAHLARCEGRAAGNWGIGCFSLYATKNITSGEGGLISTNDDGIADRLRVLRNQGMRQRYQYEMAGNNYRMTDLQAAVCLPQLKSYANLVERRRHNAEMLSNGLSNLPGIRVPMEIAGREHVWHQYTIVVDDCLGKSREDLVAGLEVQGVSSGIYYPRLVHDYDCYRTDPRVVIDETPVASRVASTCLSLPVHQHLTDVDLLKIVSSVKGCVAK